jgi:ribosomal protein S18 acetylase RimI-like enzyme
VQDRHGIVAIKTLILRHVDLDAVTKVEKHLRPLPVADQVVERRQQDCSGFPFIHLERVYQLEIRAVGKPRPLRDSLHANGNDLALSFKGLHGLGESGIVAPNEVFVDVLLGSDAETAQRYGGREPNGLLRAEMIARHPVGPPRRGQVPQSLGAGSAGHHNFALCPQEIQHPSNVAVVGPSGRPPRMDRSIIEIAGAKWALTAQLCEYVAPKGMVCGHPLPRAPPPPAFPRSPRDHLPTMDGIVLGQHERRSVSPVVEEELVPPQDLVEKRGIVGSEPGERNQELRPGYRIGRIELYASNSACHLEEPVFGCGWSRPREHLTGDREPPCRPKRDLSWGHGGTRYRLADVADILNRITAFERRILIGSATATKRFEYGTAYFNSDFPLAYSHNFLDVEDPPNSVSAAELAGIADRILGEAGLRHRTVFVRNDELGSRLDGEFDALGWTERNHVVTMAATRDPDRAVDTSIVNELDYDTVRPALMEMMRREPYADSEETVAMLVDRRTITARATHLRHYAVRDGGEIASVTDLHSDGHTAQVENVGTLEEYRGRGYARAVVSKAVEVARAEGHDLIWLVADDDDWPKELYKKLGFDPLDRYWEFTRPGPEDRRDETRS